MRLVGLVVLLAVRVREGRLVSPPHWWHCRQQWSSWLQEGQPKSRRDTERQARWYKSEPHPRRRRLLCPAPAPRRQAVRVTTRPGYRPRTWLRCSRRSSRTGCHRSWLPRSAERSPPHSSHPRPESSRPSPAESSRIADTVDRQCRVARVVTVNVRLLEPPTGTVPNARSPLRTMILVGRKAKPAASLIDPFMVIHAGLLLPEYEPLPLPVQALNA